MFNSCKYLLLVVTLSSYAMDNPVNAPLSTEKKTQITEGFSTLAQYPYKNYAPTLRTCYPNGIDQTFHAAAIMGVLNNREDQEMEKKISFLTKEMKVNVNCASGKQFRTREGNFSTPLLFDVSHTLLEEKKYSQAHQQVNIFIKKWSKSYI